MGLGIGMGLGMGLGSDLGLKTGILQKNQLKPDNAIPNAIFAKNPILIQNLLIQ
jgi:hypothetical protein